MIAVQYILICLWTPHISCCIHGAMAHCVAAMGTQKERHSNVSPRHRCSFACSSQGSLSPNGGAGISTSVVFETNIATLLMRSIIGALIPITYNWLLREPVAANWLAAWRSWFRSCESIWNHNAASANQTRERLLPDEERASCPQGAVGFRSVPVAGEKRGIDSEEADANGACVVTIV